MGNYRTEYAKARAKWNASAKKRSKASINADMRRKAKSVVRTAAKYKPASNDFLGIDHPSAASSRAKQYKNADSGRFAAIKKSRASARASSTPYRAALAAAIRANGGDLRAAHATVKSQGITGSSSRATAARKANQAKGRTWASYGRMYRSAADVGPFGAPTGFVDAGGPLTNAGILTEAPKSAAPKYNMKAPSGAFTASASYQGYFPGYHFGSEGGRTGYFRDSNWNNQKLTGRVRAGADDWSSAEE